MNSLEISHLLGSGAGSRIAAVVAAALVLAGCGSESRDPSGSAGSATGGSSSTTNGGSSSTANGGAFGGGPTGGAAVSGGGVAAYDPCPAPDMPCKILPLGDSITGGAFSSNTGGYRQFLFHLALANARNITFVGTQLHGPETVDGAPFPRHHEGHGGATIDPFPQGGHEGVSAFAVSSIGMFAPNIVLLMAGTNDIEVKLEVADAPQRLAHLVDLILDADPNLLLVVAQIVPTNDDDQNGRVQQYNATIPAMVGDRVAAGKHVMMVDMFGAFTANPNYKVDFLADHLHPNDSGYTKIADVWFAAVGGASK
jgi:lysophospholipase L1-like esterase